MRKFVVWVTAALLVAGASSAATAQTSGLVKGLGSLLPAPGPHVRTTLDADSLSHAGNPWFDGGHVDDAFVLSCPSPTEPVTEKLRIIWSDSLGKHTFTLTDITLANCETGQNLTYTGRGVGNCTGGTVTLMDIRITRGTGPAELSISLSGGGCNLSGATGSALSGTFQGCLEFGTDPTACGGSGSALSGWMTGGGTFGSPTVTHDMRLDCAGSSSDKLTASWSGGNLSLTGVESIRCTDTLSGGTGFDTISGRGTATCNGLPTSIEWRFTDAGEAGRSDTATINVTGGGPCSGFFSTGDLSGGNQQAHPR